MQKSLVLVLGCCLLLSGCSGKPTAKSCMQEMLNILNDLNDVLVTVKDKASADAARPKLEALSQRMKTLGEQMMKTTGATIDEQKWMKEEFMPAMQTTTTKLSQVMATVEDPEIKKLAGEILTGPMNAAMKKAQMEK